MSKVRLLIISSFASGFGLCSIVFAIFTMVSAFNVGSVLRLLLTVGFFAANVVFLAHYYNLMLKDLKIMSKAVSLMRRAS
ncbi:MAG: hypothetical protein WBA13_10255 [Microcoleaceae cyanobacterium]